ncbi:ArsS family sensor histidine kinase [Sulfurospirillum barnesii]|uniref:histidine kinase n=1 Tax=Sulfurospirillum barnesii (strain ATCC 700032 / DSM 10660 / SES-3) TaxID=760154 RepID=I3XZY7_SULBS|nr:ArsS family sensor histidine kinase [Sulfurospirillum barnesii]AFL69511.1 signal transduction histidine kinase [Sulfurospirillum barnesii SES-3]
MKWYHSIITRISLIFALALFGIGAIFVSLFLHEREETIRQMSDYAHIAIRSAFVPQTRQLDLSKLEELGFVIVHDSKLIQSLLELPQHPRPIPMRQMEEKMRFRMEILPYGIHMYAILHNKENPPLVVQLPYEKELFPRLFFPLLIVAFVIFLYIGILRSILPLKTLREQIKHFANGHYDITCKSSKKDEIAALANEFDAAVSKIKSLRDSRQLFLRNIMHELKTPITKGKLASEMIEDATYAKILQNVFKRQEALLEEFSRIEKLSADELKLDIKSYHIEDVVDFALDILEDKKEHITCNLSPIEISVDFELFGVALKNLLDNGINYASDGKVYLENTLNTITISNHAPELEFSLERYAEPYFLEGKKQKSSRGLGFGLFITWHVIRLHGMKLEYTHKKGINHFRIVLKSV